MWTLASRFQNMESLQIIGFDHYLLPYRWRPVLQSMCSKLTSLTLHAVTFYDKEAFFTLLAAAELVLHLILVDISFKHSHPFNVRSGTAVPMKRLLKKLEIGHRAVVEPSVDEVLSQWLSVLRDGALQDVSWASQTSSDGFPLICAGIGPASLNLEISTRNVLPPGMSVCVAISPGDLALMFNNTEHMGIQHCTRLRSITFRFDLAGFLERNREWVAGVLGQLPAPNRFLTRITFKFVNVVSLPVHEALEHLEALKADDVLAEGTFEGLNEIVLSFRPVTPIVVDVEEVLLKMNIIFEKAVSRHVRLRVVPLSV